MSKTAILVDGGFYRKRSKQLWGKHSAQESADALIVYCHRHLTEHYRKHDLYRIFYYDCPPIDKQVFHPLTQKTKNLGISEQSLWMREFLSALGQKRKVALRLGFLDTSNTVYTFNYETVKQICSGTVTKETLNHSNFVLTISQKGVDMKLGIDIASLSYKRQVDQIVLIAGDSDFVPAAKLARREGIDLVLDSLGLDIDKDSDLLRHIDGMRSCGNPYRVTDKAAP